MNLAAYILPLFCFAATAQNINLHLPENPAPKREIWMDVAGVTAMTLAGFSNALKEAMHAEPDLFGRGQGFWENESWKRKYRDYDGGDTRPAYPGSKNLLAWTTDATHFTGAVKTTGLFTGTVLLTMNEKFTLKKTGVRLLAGFVAYGLTSHITYNHLRYGEPF